MFVPAAPALSAPAQSPLAPLAGESLNGTPTTRTSLRVRSSQLNVLQDRRMTVSGTLLEDRRPGAPGLLISLQALGDRGWRTLTDTRTGRDGRFRVSFTPRRTGARFVRVLFAGRGTLEPSHRRLGQLDVFRLALASWYGGGGEMACGGQLTSSTLGVANKTLPCGTRVTLRYGSRSVTVPVVDRGPYVEGREFDLTEATKQELGFVGVGEVWSTM